MIRILEDKISRKYNIEGLDRWEIYVLIRALYLHKTPIAKGIINSFEQSAIACEVEDKDVADTIFDYAANCK